MRCGRPRRAMQEIAWDQPEVPKPHGSVVEESVADARFRVRFGLETDRFEGFRTQPCVHLHQPCPQLVPRTWEGPSRRLVDCLDPSWLLGPRKS